MKLSNKFKKKEGFTLVELIIVIAIIAVLAAIAVPNLLGSVEKSKKASDEANAKLIADAYAICIAQDGASDTVAKQVLEPTNTSGVEQLLKAKMSKIPVPESKDYKGTDSKFYIEVNNGVITVYGGAAASGGTQSTVYPK